MTFSSILTIFPVFFLAFPLSAVTELIGMLFSLRIISVNRKVKCVNFVLVLTFCCAWVGVETLL